MKCSFCGKSEDQVKKLIAADSKITICDKCVIECVKLIIYGEPEPIKINLDKK